MELPADATQIPLRASWPNELLPRLREGHESEDQDDKWSFYFNDPWLEIWRPSRDGSLGFALKMDLTGESSFHVIETWVTEWTQSWLPPDQQAKLALVLVDQFLGYSPAPVVLGDVTITKYRDRTETDYGRVRVSRYRDRIAFSGAIESHDQIQLVVQVLEEQLRALQDERPS